MRLPAFAMLVLLPMVAIAQSTLPACFATAIKHNCWGEETYPNGDTYVGEFLANEWHGKGSLTFGDGGRYVGEFRDNQFAGLGIEYTAAGTVKRSGQWKANRLVSEYWLDARLYPFDRAGSNPTESAETPRPSETDSVKAERERLSSEVAAERRKRQELEVQLAAAREQTVPASAVPPAPAAAIGNAHALVIGNAAYPGSARLDNPVNDATAISQKLRSMGFTVTTVTDANRQRLVQAMTQFRRSAASADLSLLFYSGHGVQIFGTNYILPTDVDLTDPAQATIQGVSLTNAVENFLPGATRLVFLDACRDNPLMRTGDRSVSKGLAPIAVAQGTLISYATKDGQVALDGAGAKNSPFTQALLQHIADPIDIGVVLRKVREKVMKSTGGKQQPWEYGSLTGGELVLSRVRAR